MAATAFAVRKGLCRSPGALTNWISLCALCRTLITICAGTNILYLHTCVYIIYMIHFVSFFKDNIRYSCPSVLLVMYTSVFIWVFEKWEGIDSNSIAILGPNARGSQETNVVFKLCSRQLIGTRWESVRSHVITPCSFVQRFSSSINWAEWI